MSQRGGVLVEFALILPLLLLLFFGIIEFSLLMYNKQVITNASREGARYGIVVMAGGARHSITEVQTIVQEWSGQRLITFGSDTLENSDITVTACNKEDDDCSNSANWTSANAVNAPFGYQLKVNMTYDYDFLFVPNIPLIGAENNLPSLITLDAETVMNYE